MKMAELFTSLRAEVAPSEGEETRAAVAPEQFDAALAAVLDERREAPEAEKDPAREAAGEAGAPLILRADVAGGVAVASDRELETVLAKVAQAIAKIVVPTAAEQAPSAPEAAVAGNDASSATNGEQAVADEAVTGAGPEVASTEPGKSAPVARPDESRAAPDTRARSRERSPAGEALLAATATTTAGAAEVSPRELDAEQSSAKKSKIKDRAASQADVTVPAPGAESTAAASVGAALANGATAGNAGHAARATSHVGAPASSVERAGAVRAANGAAPVVAANGAAPVGAANGAPAAAKSNRTGEPPAISAPRAKELIAPQGAAAAASPSGPLAPASAKAAPGAAATADAAAPVAPTQDLSGADVRVRFHRGSGEEASAGDAPRTVRDAGSRRGLGESGARANADVADASAPVGGDAIGGKAPTQPVEKLRADAPVAAPPRAAAQAANQRVTPAPVSAAVPMDSAARASAAERGDKAGESPLGKQPEAMARVEGFSQGARVNGALSAYGGGRGHEGAEHASREERFEERESESSGGDPSAFAPTFDAPVAPVAAPPSAQTDVRAPEPPPPAQAAPELEPPPELPDFEFARGPGVQPQAASISLHHPDLGSIQIQVERRLDKVEVSAVIESTHAEAVLRANESGIRLGVQQSGMTFSALRVKVRGEEKVRDTARSDASVAKSKRRENGRRV